MKWSGVCVFVHAYQGGTGECFHVTMGSNQPKNSSPQKVINQ